MQDAATSSSPVINQDVFRDKVLGCWTGKNIGGTLGAPFEGKREMNDATFYVQKLDGNPAPNDDLDLQLVWLQAAEDQGLNHLTPRLLGEYWINFIVGPWNEYGVCKANIVNGLYPPLSGSCNNDRWKYSNGAWIRSEIWACLFPGAPDEAARFAAMDACCDHCGEGIYAEIFTAAMQSAAFVIADIRQIIAIGLAKIPPECRVAQSVKLACRLFDQGTDFKAARAAIVKDSEDLGWFQAPGNLGFVILGLLYGQGDFGRSICLANNCGDDTDCTAATAGALLGIIHGRSGLPESWIKPIGNGIMTVAINPFGMKLPRTLNDLTERVIALALKTQRDNPDLPQVTPAPTTVAADYVDRLCSSEVVKKHLWSQPPYALVFDLPYAGLVVDYENGPSVTPGEAKQVTIRLIDIKYTESVVHVAFKLPEGWTAVTTPSASINSSRRLCSQAKITLIPGAMNDAFIYIPLEVRLAGRFNPITLQVPFQRQEAISHTPFVQD